MQYIFLFFCVLYLFIAVHASSVVILIKKDNEVEIQKATDYEYFYRDYTIHASTLSGEHVATYDRILVDCDDTCNTDTVSESELRLLSTYASYVHSFGALPSKVDFGLLKDTDSTNIYGMFVLYSDGRINFFVRHTVFEGVSVDTAYLLLLDVAAHERAHYDNYVNNGEFGHNDNFQREFNVLFWSALEKVDQYKRLYIENDNTAHYSNTATTNIIIVGSIIVAALVIVCLCARTPSGRTVRNVDNTKLLQS